MKIDKDKSKMECLASSGGFILGIAIDSNKNVYACEMKEAALYKYDSVNKSFTEFAKGPKIPNYPVIDSKRNCIYVSDSFGFNEKGPSGIGKENYTWYQKNVHLVPLTWEEEVDLLKKEKLLLDADNFIKNL